jgi:hypothetical protein
VPDIGVMREGPLHAAVKELLAEPGDRLEVPVGRFVIDLVRADGELVEVQTARSSTRCWTITACGSCTRSRPSAGSSGSTSTARS